MSRSLEFLPRRAFVRFRSLTDSSPGPDACWPWLGYRNTPPPGKASRCWGYGRMSVAVGWIVAAHRLAFFLATGEEPNVVMHTCDNPGCVNPRHLRGGTQKENIRDASTKGRLRGQPNHTVSCT